MLAKDVERNAETVGAAGRGADLGAAQLLTEPVLVTVQRDLRQVWTKLRFFLSLEQEDAVLLQHEIRNYELRGPFLFYVAFAALLVARHRANFEQVFTVVISFLFLGSAVVALNARLLRAKLTFSQGLCVAGYSTFPLTAAAAAALVLVPLPRFLLYAAVALGFCWAVKSAHRAMRCVAGLDRQLAATAPFALFHAALAWFVLLCS